MSWITKEKTASFGRMMGAWLRRFWWTLALFALGLFVFQHYFLITINASQSLPQKVFLVLKQEKAVRAGDYVAFVWKGELPYPRGIGFVKQVAGVQGDEVTEVNREFFVNGQSVGRAKERADLGVVRNKDLKLGPTGVIPAHRFYVRASHLDSLDSRYAMVGWVKEETVIGRAIPLF
jgi:conjugal transfer pilin signal peptidase TrbI